MKWAKFKKWTKIEDIAEHERQPKYVWWSVILDFRKPFKEFHSQNILPVSLGNPYPYITVLRKSFLIERDYLTYGAYSK